MKRLILTLILLLLFAPHAQAQLRPMVYSDTVVEADINTVWADWTSAEGLESFLASKAVVDPRPGGTYDVWLKPDASSTERGSVGGTILALQDNNDGSRMISFTWTAGPNVDKTEAQMTAVQIWFISDNADRTCLRLFHTGFGDGKAWQDSRRYFAQNWPEVLRDYQAHIRAENAH